MQISIHQDNNHINDLYKNIITCNINANKTIQQWVEYKNENLIGCSHILLHFKYEILIPFIMNRLTL